MMKDLLTPVQYKLPKAYPWGLSRPHSLARLLCLELPNVQTNFLLFCCSWTTNPFWTTKGDLNKQLNNNRWAEQNSWTDRKGSQNISPKYRKISLKSSKNLSKTSHFAPTYPNNVSKWPWIGRPALGGCFRAGLYSDGTTVLSLNNSWTIDGWFEQNKVEQQLVEQNNEQH